MDLGRLVLDHQSSLYAFLYRMTGDPHLAEDLMQDTFVRALQASAKYQPQGRLSAWLFAIALNLTKDHWRKTYRQPTEDCLPIDRHKPIGSVEDEVETAITAEGVREALLTLPFEQRAPLILFYYHDMTYEDIANCLVIPIGTVRSRIHNAKTRLGRVLRGVIRHE